VGVLHVVLGGGETMQERRFGSIGDLVKLAFLRHLQEGRHLAVCWYLTGQGANRPLSEKHFAYLKRPGEFRNLAPAIFDTLKSVVESSTVGLSYITALEASGVLNDAVFHHEQVPRRAALRKSWTSSLVDSVSKANLIFLDPDNGIQGRQLTSKHVALAEIAALRRQDRTLITVQHQSGQKLEVRSIAERLKTIGCQRLEIVRFRLVSSQFYVVVDYDNALDTRISSFARKWGNWAKIYHF
jgi:hypothetical protein